MADEDIVARMERMLAEKEKKSAVASVMQNGGGAVTGGLLGWTAGGLAAVALAPITGGLSILVPPLVAVAGGVMGHKMSKDID
jgi:hypothetical protein